MAKPGLLKALLPIGLGAGAALLGPEILGLGAPAEAGATAAGVSDVVPAGLLDAAGGVVPDVGTATATGFGATPLAETAPSLLGATDAGVSGLADTVSGLAGAIPAAAGAAGGVGGAGPGLLGAGVGPTADTAAAPAALATTPAATPAAANTAGLLSPSPASPISAATEGPAGGFNISPDFTSASTLGPPQGTSPVTANLLATGSDLGGGTPATTATGAAGTDLPDIFAAQGTPIGTIGEGADTTQGGVGGFLSGAGDWALSHPGALASAAILAPELISGQHQYPQTQPISNIAGSLTPQGAAAIGTGAAGLGTQATSAQQEAAALEAPLTTGVLPPGLQQTVEASTQAQKAQLRSSFAANGLSGSTMEAQALAKVDSDAAAQKAGIATGLLQPAQGFSGQANQAFSGLAGLGSNITGMSIESYNQLLSAAMKSDQNYQAALTNFARALAGGGYAPTSKTSTDTLSSNA